jgi:glycosyltransferase involved in cell wall biosynthesis
MLKDVKITFIIPTIGRETLKDTLSCLLMQTNPNWRAVVIFDGIESNIDVSDERIEIVEAPKIGIGKNSAGRVRNYGILYAETEWVAFVDDDDAIKKEYVEIFLNETQKYTNDVIIFRMLNFDGDILPKNKTYNFYECSVGISFAVKKEIFDSGMTFDPSHLEDYKYLNKLRENNYNIMISPYILYFVRNYDTEQELPLCDRTFINYYFISDKTDEVLI